MQNNQIDIKDFVLQTYQKNLLFLEKEHPTLYKKISALQLAIDKNYYQEKYILEYKENSYFDVKELSTGIYLYGSNSYQYAKLAAESVNYKKTDNLFETFYNFDFSEKAINNLKQKDILKYSYSTVAELIHYSNKFASKSDTTMKKLYKYIFIGVGLGTHLIEIHKKLHSNVYFIIENDLELFRLSLFVTDYQQLTQEGTKLFFSVFDDDEEFKTITQQFLNEQFIYNHYIKFFHMLNHSEHTLKKIQSIIATQSYLTFNYAAAMTSLLRPLEYIKEGYKFLNINASYENTILNHKPVLIIGAGPSFQKNIEWLKQNHHKYIIVIVSALMSKFEELSIKPDIITHIHGFSDAMPHIEKVKDIHFFDSSIGLFGGMSYPEFTKKFNKNNIYIIEGASHYKHNFGGIVASNIGAITYGLFLYLGIKEIYLLGLDFALEQDTGNTHTNSHSHVKSLDISKQTQLEDAVSVQKEIITVKGNFRETVKTTLFFDTMKQQCNALTYSYKKPNTITYNLSDGAYINETVPLHTENIDITNCNTVTDIFTELQELFNKNSENFLTNEEMDDILKRIKYYDNIITRLKKHQMLEHVDLNHYHYNLIGTFQDCLSKDIHNVQESDINSIITLYLQFVSGYIFDLINTTEIKDEKELITHLDQIVISQMIRVIEYFKNAVENIIKDITIIQK